MKFLKAVHRAEHISMLNGMVVHARLPILINLSSTQCLEWAFKIQLWLSQFSSGQSLSHVWLFVTPWTAACQASLSITNSRSLLKLMSIESVMPSNHLILCHPLLLPPSILPSIRVFSSESVLHKGSQSIGVSVSITPSNEYSGLISFRIDWLNLLAAQGTLNNLLQHHSSKASVLWHSAFFFSVLFYLFKF